MAARREEDSIGGGARTGRLTVGVVVSVKPSGHLPQPSQDGKAIIAMAGSEPRLGHTVPNAGELRWQGPLQRIASKAMIPSHITNVSCHPGPMGFVTMRPFLDHQASLSRLREVVKACWLRWFHSALRDVCSGKLGVDNGASLVPKTYSALSRGEPSGRLLRQAY